MRQPKKCIVSSTVRRTLNPQCDCSSNSWWEKAVDWRDVADVWEVFCDTCLDGG